MPFVSDFFDFSIYLDADEAMHRALVCRALHDAARDRVPRSAARIFHKYADLSESEALETAHGLWNRINLAQSRRKHPADPAAAPTSSCARARATSSSRSRWRL